MVNFSDFQFLSTPPGWDIGPLHYHSLGFSADGKTLSASNTSSRGGNSKPQVVCWDTATGITTSKFTDYYALSFSPSDSQVAIMAGTPGLAKIVQSTAADGVQKWTVNEVETSYGMGRCEAVIFRPDGLKALALCTLAPSWPKYDLHEMDVAPLGDSLRTFQFTEVHNPGSLSTYVYSPIEVETVFVCQNIGRQQTIRYGERRGEIVVLGSSTGPDCTGITTSAWSRNGMWIATGDHRGDVHLWDAHNTSRVIRLKTLPRNRTEAIMTLVFTHDSSLLFIVNAGHYLDVYDIERGDYITNSGLPARGKNVAVDGPRDIVAVATMDDKIMLYSLQPRQNASQDDKITAENPKPHDHTPQQSSIPALLSLLDITKDVTRPKSAPFPGSYFDIYRGAWKLSSPYPFHHAVAIKVLRPGFNPRSKKQERQDFKDLLTKCLTKWTSVPHNNLVPLLGVCGNFGEFPALVTSWMMNGLLSEYLKSEEEYEEMGLMMDVAKGVAHLHCKSHNDCRNQSLRVDVPF
ncbi:hypothetical protein CVT24_011496 [Panaeolus cyanescens]|uniref:Protein kinase domain-containing protein n=1 Tax=Panaeolus cyanescens TaxID=181874 RepID=A0A409YGV1_9AGAR|nr:hypothetical protein CVT24_011496 [Panaeolus cyanescens]